MLAKGRNEEQAVPEALARFGFLSRGVVYVLIGGTAARVAILKRGRTTGPAGALARVLTGSGGRLLLWVVVAGAVEAARAVLGRLPAARHGRKTFLPGRDPALPASLGWTDRVRVASGRVDRIRRAGASP